MQEQKEAQKRLIDECLQDFYASHQVDLLNSCANATGQGHAPGRILRAAIQARRSLASEGKSKSIKQQIQEGLQVALLMGYSVDPKHIYAEKEGVKGDWSWPGSGLPNPNRNDLGSLVKATEQGEIDVVITWRTDRLYRDAGVADALLKLMVRHKVALVASRRDYAIHTAAGYANAMGEAVRNREFRDKVSEDIKRDHDFKAKLGQITRSPACLGFRSAGKGTHAAKPIPHELDIVRRIFIAYVIGENGEGPMRVTQIANRLVAEKVPIPYIKEEEERKCQKVLTGNDITRILKNVSYIAKWRHAGNEYDCPTFLVDASDGSGRKETVVPLDLWQKAQEKLSWESKYDKKSGSHGVPHLLSGLVLCGICGRRQYVVTNSDGIGNFRCEHRFFVDNLCKPYPTRALNEKALEGWVLEELTPLLLLQLDEIRSSAGREADRQLLAMLNHRLDQAKKRETVELARQMSHIDEVQFAGLAAQFRAEREGLTRQVREVAQRLEAFGDPLLSLNAETITQMPPSELRAALHYLIRWMAVCLDGVVVLTRWGTYIAATYRPGDRSRGEHHRRIMVATATPADVLSCLSWLPNPALFVQGRRSVLGRKAAYLTDAELLPGLDSLAYSEGHLDGDQGYIPEFALPLTDEPENAKCETCPPPIEETQPISERRWKKRAKPRRLLSA